MQQVRDLPCHVLCPQIIHLQTMLVGTYLTYLRHTDRWIQAGWNVGAFYWNQYADEELPQDTECKIWTSK